MRHLTPVFKSLARGWNRRAFTEKDFFRICKKLKVFVYEEDSEDMEWEGFYFVDEGVPTIVINGKLKGLKRLWAMFHELGHHLLHTPETCFFSENTYDKAQSEANIFAAIALIPEKTVRQMPLWELYDLDEFSAKLFQIRLEVFDTYKM